MANEITTNSTEILHSQDDIQRKIYTLRGVQVMLDRDLATLYQVETKYVNRAVKRTPTRFPEDFVFQLMKEEYENLRFQNGILNTSSESDVYDENIPSRFKNGTLNNGRGHNLNTPHSPSPKKESDSFQPF